MASKDPALNKMQTAPVFPKLGVTAVRSPTALVETKQGVKNKIAGAYSALAVDNKKLEDGVVDETFAGWRRQSLKNPPVGTNFAGMPAGIAPAYAMSNSLRQQVKTDEGGPTPNNEPSPTTDLGTVQHENFHDVMNQVERRHGKDGRKRLAGRIVKELRDDKDHGGPMGWFVNEHVARSYSFTSPHFHEEVLAKLHNVMNDPAERKFMARFHFGTEELPRHVDSKLKSAWKHFQRLAADADESWTEAPMGDVMEKAVAGIKPQGEFSYPTEVQSWKNSGTPQGYHDYSHLLPESFKAKGFRLGVTDAKTHKGEIHGVLVDSDGDEAGGVKGVLRKPNTEVHRAVAPPDATGVEPHSYLDFMLRGQGLGSAMYEALYAHAKNVHGATHILGGIHSEDANRLHQRLAAKHGFEYHGGQVEQLGTRGGVETPRIGTPSHQPYAYTLKEELPAAAEPDVFETPVFGVMRDIKKSEQDTQEVVLVLATNGSGEMLLGKRNDSGRWTMPGGHVEPGEDPETGAHRELFEETGLKPESLTHLMTVEPEKPGQARIHIFTAMVFGTPHNTHDPDEECDTWEWVDVKGGIPQKVWDNLQGPDGDKNVLRQVFDVKDEMKKSEDLLRHPDPVERLMALRFDTTTPQDVATAALDHEPLVWRAALQHELSHHARAVLLQSTHDHDGFPLFDRHDAILQDPELSHDELQLHYNTVLHADLDPQFRADRLSAVAAHPNFDSPETLQKHWGDELINRSNSGSPLASSEREKTQPHLRHLHAAFKQHVSTAEPIKPHDSDAGLGEPGWGSPKVIYKMPVPGHHDEQRMMVKPYAEHHHRLSGWAEASSQHLYHAAGIGDLHQASFVADHGEHDDDEDSWGNIAPATVIHIENSHPVSSEQAHNAMAANPDAAAQARKIGLMDFLTANNDRHVGNFMVRPDGKPLAIDHGDSFKSYRNASYEEFHRNTKAPQYVSSWNPEDHHDTLKWWSNVGSDVRRAFEERLGLVDDPEKKEELHRGFSARATWLDTAAKTSAAGQLPDFSQIVSTGNLAKKMAGDGFLHDQNAPDMSNDIAAYNPYPKNNFKDAHKSFIGAHPEAAHEKAQLFEQHIAQSPELVKPVMGRFDGIEPKAVYKHADHHFIVKGFHVKSTPESGWNEMVSQSLYHAAGIGDLHQHVHVTEHGHERLPALVIHMAPDHLTASQDAAADGKRLDAAQANPEHMESLRRIGMMDHALHNTDRHDSNLMLAEDGKPLAIDHGYSFSEAHEYALGRSLSGGINHTDTVKPRQHSTSAWTFGGMPTPETWKWWDAARPAILKTFEEHANKIKNEDYRNKLKEVFRGRLDKIEDMRARGLYGTGLGERLRQPTSDSNEDSFGGYGRPYAS